LCGLPFSLGGIKIENGGSKEFGICPHMANVIGFQKIFYLKNYLKKKTNFTAY
jgi:hypothetical protein